MRIHLADRAIEQLAESIDIPDSAYETAERRYRDLGTWFARLEARCSRFSPHVYPQGSFRFGTVVRPLDDNGEYDLDLGCRLRKGVAKETHTQKQLKDLVGADLEDYRIARQIAEPRKEKRRCWRLQYADKPLSFHMDVVPSIPGASVQRQLLKAALARAGTSDLLATAVIDHTGAITDNQLPNFSTLSGSWRVSNSEGFALWFESRMKLADALLQERVAVAKAARIDDLPAYAWRTPLQRCVQILKRHRDVMFRGNPASKPISAILTTLSGRAYNGETEILPAIRRVLSTMAGLVQASAPRVPNPVNPAEDFADKWGDPALSHLRLEESFWNWLKRAQADFGVLETTGDAQVLTEHVRKSFATTLDSSRLAGVGPASRSLLESPFVASALSFPPKPLVPSKPAGFA